MVVKKPLVQETSFCLRGFSMRGDPYLLFSILPPRAAYYSLIHFFLRSVAAVSSGCIKQLFGNLLGRCGVRRARRISPRRQRISLPMAGRFISFQRNKATEAENLSVPPRDRLDINSIAEASRASERACPVACIITPLLKRLYSSTSLQTHSRFLT